MVCAPKALDDRNSLLPSSDEGAFLTEAWDNFDTDAIFCSEPGFLISIGDVAAAVLIAFEWARELPASFYAISSRRSLLAATITSELGVSVKLGRLPIEVKQVF